VGLFVPLKKKLIQRSMGLMTGGSVVDASSNGFTSSSPDFSVLSFAANQDEMIVKVGSYATSPIDMKNGLLLFLALN
jgi:hypothetical protein